MTEYVYPQYREADHYDLGQVFKTKEFSGGLTLRDYIAVHALNALLSNPSSGLAHDFYAKEAYKAADAMLVAKEKK